ncbi:hypothetical protein BDV24DRAFT_140015 [Aspergillus arachidicola]|uniref:Uncharacterized protein n=1 Tax=Aspergillus arachidicola TaxID=656916 RepID=A0A2G7FMV9_9EURO|nr:hypothetical protein BDV24DRAFT_140015 [Aspergillus arachidicola]PIG81982.1 hypothetical protein AARAC_002277 [Aspergillus arachidicola]
MPSASPLEATAVVAAAKVRSKILRASHDRYPWLFISPESKEDVRPVVEALLANKDILQRISEDTGVVFATNPFHNIVDYYPIIWTQRSGKVEPPFPGKVLVIVGLEYVDQNNGLPKLHKRALFPGDYVSILGDNEIHLSDGGGGTSLFIILEKS